MVSFSWNEHSLKYISKALTGKLLTDKTKFQTVIIDLGTGKDNVDGTKARTTDLGNKFIRAPEAFSNEQIHDDISDKRFMDGADHPKADLYSIGANLIKLLCPDREDKNVLYFYKHSEASIKTRLEAFFNDLANPVQVLLKEVLF